MLHANPSRMEFEVGYSSARRTCWGRRKRKGPAVIAGPFVFSLLCRLRLVFQRDHAEAGGNVEAAKEVGKLIAERAQAVGVKKVVFDRGGYLYHGRIKALADAAREAGLEF